MQGQDTSKITCDWFVPTMKCSHVYKYIWKTQALKFLRDQVETRVQNLGKISAEFGGGQKKNLKLCNTLIHVLYNSKLTFSIVYIVYSSIQ
jgi:hypothetical protein